MKLYRDNAIWACESRYEERLIPKAAGFRWDPARRRWWTDSREKAARLVEHADADTAADLRGVLDAVAASSAVDADAVIPAPPGRTYYGFQKAGIKFILKGGDYDPSRGILLADEMG